MAEKLEDLNLPNVSVQKIIKNAIPENINVGKDARSALSRAASIFVLYVTSQASEEAQKLNRKTMSGQDVITALEELDFEQFVEPLQEFLTEFRTSKPKKSKAKKATNGEEDVELIEDVEEVDDEESVE